MNVIEKKKIRVFGIAVVLLILTLLFWVRLTVHSMQMAYRIRSIETEIIKEQRKQMDLERQKNAHFSLAKVEHYAKNSLGLVVPPQDAIIIKYEPQ